MRILHLSDLHIADKGIPIWNTDTKAHFDCAIGLIRKMKNVDAIIVTGDISDDGSEWSYSYVDNAFQTLNIPTYCCPGNHDDLITMSRMSYCRQDRVFYMNGWRFLILDSTIPNMARGLLTEDTMDLIDTELSKEDVPTIVAFHHPSIEPGGWLSRKLLENREMFNMYVSTKPNIKLVLYGHTHYSIQHKIGDTIFSSAPSVGFAFDKELPKFQIAEGQEGFDMIDIERRIISISHYLIN